MVISVSRRCDIPRFAFNWFLERLEAGFVEVKNPFNSLQTKRVTLLPPVSSSENLIPRGQETESLKAEGQRAEDSVELFAFWTRDPAAILEHSSDLEKRGYAFFVMTTLTGYPAILEPNAPDSESVIKTMARLAEKISPDRVIWRYDPIFLSYLTDFDFHRRNFTSLAGRLKGTVNRIIVSVYDEYPAAERRLLKLEGSGLKRMAHYDQEKSAKSGIISLSVRNLLTELAEIAHAHGMEIQSCAEEDLSDCGISPGACIDAGYISKIFGIKTPGKDRSQRPRCLCAQSVDIGTYGACPAGCVYCYASK